MVEDFGKRGRVHHVIKYAITMTLLVPPKRIWSTNTDQSDFQLLEDLGDDVSIVRAYAGT